jgi:hypothetical protein
MEKRYEAEVLSAMGSKSKSEEYGYTFHPSFMTTTGTSVKQVVMMSLL